MYTIRTPQIKVTAFCKSNVHPTVQSESEPAYRHYGGDRENDLSGPRLFTVISATKKRVILFSTDHPAGMSVARGSAAVQSDCIREDRDPTDRRSTAEGRFEGFEGRRHPGLRRSPREAAVAGHDSRQAPYQLSPFQCVRSVAITLARAQPSRKIFRVHASCQSFASFVCLLQTSKSALCTRCRTVSDGIMAATRERRSNAGSRLARLLDEEEDEDDFYKNTYGGFNEEEEDNDFHFAEEDAPPDEVDSDFSIDENDEVISDVEDEEKSQKKTNRCLNI